MAGLFGTKNGNGGSTSNTRLSDLTDTVWSDLPASGTFAQGQIFKKSNPIPGGHMFWIVTQSGPIEAVHNPWRPNTEVYDQYTIEVNGHVYKTVAASFGYSGKLEPIWPIGAGTSAIDMVDAVAWTASKVVQVDDMILPTAGGNYYCRCKIAGTTGTTQPTWSNSPWGDTKVDGTVTWESRQITTWFYDHALAVIKPWGLIGE